MWIRLRFLIPLACLIATLIVWILAPTSPSSIYTSSPFKLELKTPVTSKPFTCSKGDLLSFRLIPGTDPARQTKHRIEVIPDSTQTPIVQQDTAWTAGDFKLSEPIPPIPQGYTELNEFSLTCSAEQTLRLRLEWRDVQLSPSQAAIQKRYTQETVFVSIKHSPSNLASGWLLFFQTLLFFTITCIAWAGRERSTRALINRLAEGSELSIKGTRYTVADVRKHTDSWGDTTFELRLSPQEAGVDRYLSVDWLEEEVGDTTKAHHLILMEQPLSETYETSLEEAMSNTGAIKFNGVRYHHDADNSTSSATQTILAHGQTYSSNYSSRLFRASYPKTGERIFERIEYSNGNHEWSALEVIDWRTIDFHSVQTHS